MNNQVPPLHPSCALSLPRPASGCSRSLLPCALLQCLLITMRPMVMSSSNRTKAMLARTSPLMAMPLRETERRLRKVEPPTPPLRRRPRDSAPQDQRRGHGTIPLLAPWTAHYSRDEVGLTANSHSGIPVRSMVGAGLAPALGGLTANSHSGIPDVGVALPLTAQSAYTINTAGHPVSTRPNAHHTRHQSP